MTQNLFDKEELDTIETALWFYYNALAEESNDVNMKTFVEKILEKQLTKIEIIVNKIEVEKKDAS